MLLLLCSLISDDLQKGFIKRAERTFRVSLSLALISGVAVMCLMEVRAELEVCCFMCCCMLSVVSYTVMVQVPRSCFSSIAMECHC